jgi:hypothetical protein
VSLRVRFRVSLSIDVTLGRGDIDDHELSKEDDFIDDVSNVAGMQERTRSLSDLGRKSAEFTTENAAALRGTIIRNLKMF